MQKHVDGTPFAFNILLNSEREFEGGGTRFYTNDNDYELVELKQGDLVLHSGKTQHAGNAITSGIRYILVGFISLLSKNSPDLIKKTVPKSPFINDFEIKEVYNNNVLSYLINSSIDDDILDYYEKQIEYIKINKSKSNQLNVSSLDLTNEKMDVVEKLVYELYIFHMKRLNLIHNLSDYYVEFWSNINILLPGSPSLLKNIHCDKDEEYYSNKKTLYSPILSTITYYKFIKKKMLQL